MALVEAGAGRLERIACPMPPLGARQLRLRVHTCGVCRTDLHLVDGELATPSLPRIPGHEIVGTVVEQGTDCRRFRLGERIGVPWLGGTCEHCRPCTTGRENLCAQARFTGWSLEASTDLGAWAPLPGTPVLDGPDFSVTAPASPTRRFFRLRENE